MLQNHLQWYPESWTAAFLSFTLLTRCSFETACLVIASAECQPYGHGHLVFTWIRSTSRILLLVWCFYSWMQFEGIVCGPAWYCGSIFLVGVFLKQKKINRNFFGYYFCPLRASCACCLAQPVHSRTGGRTPSAWSCWRCAYELE